MRISCFITLLAFFLLTNCNKINSANRIKNPIQVYKEINQTQKNDSAEVLTLLQNVYKWHEQNKAKLIDFEIIAKDSFLIGLNIQSFQRTYNAIQKTDYFSDIFLRNYKKIGDLVNYKLTHSIPKFFNQNYFYFQDADPWTYQENARDTYWDHFEISEFKISSHNASLRWWLKEGFPQYLMYSVKFKKENGKWKVSYLDGFNIFRYKYVSRVDILK